MVRLLTKHPRIILDKVDRTIHRETALQYAALKGHTETVQVLLDAGNQERT
jgi:ankyrin repeat protein